VFFAGCNLRCVFCQNHEISRAVSGEALSPEGLADVFFDLAAQGVHNINLVTPTPHIPTVAAAIRIAKSAGLTLPFVYNTSAYETVEALRTLAGFIDIYLPDLKYRDEDTARRYAQAPGYFEAATAAILEMTRQVGTELVLSGGLLKRGLLIRHLVLPGQRKDALRILDWIAATLPDAAVSLMVQYIPAHRAGEYPELNRRLTTFEYNSVAAHMQTLGLTKGYHQAPAAAVADYIPAFSPPTSDL
jgi:putative pyruvate formate lyase activating enzyme